MSDNASILRALAHEAAAIKEENKEAGTKGASSSGFYISLYEYPDMIITKNGAKVKKHLVLMPSAGAAFIKIEKKGEDARSEALNERNYASFASGMDIEMPEGFWIRNLTAGVKTGRRLSLIFKDKLLLEIIRKNVLPENVDLMDYNGEFCPKPEGPILEAYRRYPKLVTEYKNKQKVMNLLLKAPIFCSEMVERFGLNNVRDFLNEYENSLTNLIRNVYNGGWYTSRDEALSRSSHSLNNWEFVENGGKYTPGQNEGYPWIPGCSMRFDLFKDYVLYESFRMGYGDNIENFFSEWIDSLEMQYEIYGKIREKYPENLPTVHKQLSYKKIVMQEKIDEKLFAQQAEKAKMYSGNYKEFTFVAPACRQDFLDEATMQSNCLAGYVNKFMNGGCLIIFMRKKNSPDRSYITVEIVDGQVNQAKYARNKNLSEYDARILMEWVEKCRLRNAAQAV